MEKGCGAGVWSRGVEQGCGTGVWNRGVEQGCCTAWMLYRGIVQCIMQGVLRSPSFPGDGLPYSSDGFPRPNQPTVPPPPPPSNLLRMASGLFWMAVSIAAASVSMAGLSVDVRPPTSRTDSVQSWDWQSSEAT